MTASWTRTGLMLTAAAAPNKARPARGAIRAAKGFIPPSSPPPYPKDYKKNRRKLFEVFMPKTSVKIIFMSVQCPSLRCPTKILDLF